MAKGKKTGGGSRKGRPNKLTATVKQAIFEAFNQLGGTKYLVKLGREHPEAFARVLVRLLPYEVAGEVNMTHELALQELERAAKDESA